MMLRAVGTLREAERISDSILTVAEDGTVSPGEVDAMRRILDYLQNIGSIADEMQLWVRKHMG